MPKAQPTEDSGLHSLPGLTRAELVEVLRREQVVGEPLAPLPADIDAERAIVSNIEPGGTTHEDLMPLAQVHFTSAVLGEAFELLREMPSIEHAAAQLFHRGFGRLAAAEIEALDFAPALGRAQLQQQAQRVIELWRRRRLVCALRAVEASVCAGLSFDEGVGELRKTVLEVRG